MYRITIGILAAASLAAQDHHMPGMSMTDINPAAMHLMRLALGTSVNPASWPMPMLMKNFGKWNTMWMAAGFISSIQQTGPRGGDKLYSTNTMMAAAEHRVGSGAFQAEVMLSLEPLTVTGRRYPLLFQTGETAYGIALRDAQHPHNFIMGLGVRYSQQLADSTTLDLYFAPVGDPAIGPVAYPHRASAAEFPEAPISHHWQDSTHIADEVVTAGITYRKLKLEASGFYGTEPGEDRWTINTGSINSWSGRLWFFPSQNWAAQFSAGRIARPEALEPGDQVRTTASLHYTRPMPGGSWSSSLIWGRTHSTATLRNLNSYLAESVVPVSRRNFLTGRFELVDKDELLAAPQTYRIGAYTIGYTRDIELLRYFETGLGVNFTAYSLPLALKPHYGDHPAGGNLFVRFRLKRPG